MGPVYAEHTLMLRGYGVKILGGLYPSQGALFLVESGFLAYWHQVLKRFGGPVVSGLSKVLKLRGAFRLL